MCSAHPPHPIGLSILQNAALSSLFKDFSTIRTSQLSTLLGNFVHYWKKLYNTLFCPNKNQLQFGLKPFKLRRGSCAFETGQTKPRCSQHVNVVTVREIVVCSNMDQIFIVMDFVQYDLKGLMDTTYEKEEPSFPFGGGEDCKT